jgi:hypothetical protein
MDRLPKGNEAIAAKRRKIRKIKIRTPRLRWEAATFVEATGAKSAGAAGWTRMNRMGRMKNQNSYHFWLAIALCRSYGALDFLGKLLQI